MIRVIGQLWSELTLEDRGPYQALADKEREKAEAEYLKHQNLLKEVTAKHKREMFLCRYGGDEFVLVSRNADDATVAELKESIKSASEKFNKNSGKPYEINFSVGCYVGGFGSQEAFQTPYKQQTLICTKIRNRIIKKNNNLNRLAKRRVFFKLLISHAINKC